MKNYSAPSENISTKNGAFSSSRVPIRHQFFNWKWKLLKFPLKVRSYFIAFFQLRQLLITSLDKQNSYKPFFWKKRKIFIPKLRGSINKFFAKRRIFIYFSYLAIWQKKNNTLHFWVQAFLKVKKSRKQFLVFSILSKIWTN